MIFKKFALIVFFTVSFFICEAESLRDDKVRLLLTDASSSKSLEGSPKEVSKSVSKNPAESSQRRTPKSVFKSFVEESQEEIQKPVPDFDKERPYTKGIILAFHHWPNEKEKTMIFKKMTKAGLKKTLELQRTKTWLFEWPDWHKGLEAEKLCKDLSTLSLPSLNYCEPDYLLKLDISWLKKLDEGILAYSQAGGTKTSSPCITTPPQSNLKLNPLEVPANQTGDIKTCNIASSQLKLSGGQLSDYWAQEMIGADLLREELIEELREAPPFTKHLVAVFDSPCGNRHDMRMKNVISGKGKQAVLPELKVTSFKLETPNDIPDLEGNHNISIHRVSGALLYEANERALLSRVERECGIEREGYR